jgi:hypothetical protein
MRRVFTLVALLAGLGLVGLVGGAVAQINSCTVTCPSGQVLHCNPTSFCTSVPGTSINCDGTLMQCPLSCEEQCWVDFDNCNSGCDPQIPATCRICARSYTFCLNQCP